MRSLTFLLALALCTALAGCAPQAGDSTVTRGPESSYYADGGGAVTHSPAPSSSPSPSPSQPGGGLLEEGAEGAEDLLEDAKRGLERVGEGLKEGLDRSQTR